MGKKKEEKLSYKSAPTSPSVVNEPLAAYKTSTSSDLGYNYFESEKDISAGRILGNYKNDFSSPHSKLVAIKKGLQAQALLDLMFVTGATRVDIAHLLDLTEPTLRKYITAGKELNIGLSEHILQLFELFDKGMDTFGSLDDFKNWLPKHNIGMDAKPIDLLDTITGISIVMNELLRIDYGVLA
jgi:putative toxin-antitoxin system antitoxin component (TIGR02293 family)